MDRDRIDQLLDHMEMNMRTVRSYLAGNDLDGIKMCLDEVKDDATELQEILETD